MNIAIPLMPALGATMLTKFAADCQKGKALHIVVYTENLVQGLIRESCHNEPASLNDERKQNKPKMSLAEGFNDAFKFPEAQIDESCPQKEHKYEQEFPH
ncbi:MAG: hypothetical protein QM730_00910 [Anaerolineales bacterium]